MRYASKSSADIAFRTEEAFARELDATDPLRSYRDRFALPRNARGEPLVYLCGNSLGLMPKTVRDVVNREIQDWETLGVKGHFDAGTPWYSYHEVLREPLAQLVGAEPHEVVAMNGLTVNLHLMMVSFYRPSAERHKILIEASPFPSDRYAVQSQLQWHGYDANEGLLEVHPRDGEDCLRTEDLESLLTKRGREIALVMLGGVNYYTGQFFDLDRITRAARRAGCVVGYDLAHAVGNVPLALHAWDVDFAVWCSYKYLNGGPGSVAGAFVHERYGTASLPRFAGWWGNDPETRFRMQSNVDFVPQVGADGWQISNPPILSMAGLRPSLDIFTEAGIPALRRKSVRLTGYLEYLIDHNGTRHLEIITPRDQNARGCQLSIRVPQHGRAMFDELSAHGVVGDFRDPDVIRLAPVPLYNTFHEVWQVGGILNDIVTRVMHGKSR